MTITNAALTRTAFLVLFVSITPLAPAEHGDITTIVGSGERGYCDGDGGPAIDACLYYPSSLAIDAAGNLFIGDYFNDRVRKVHATDGVIASSDLIWTVAGNGVRGDSGDGGLATDAQLNRPGFIALDAEGNLFISDVFNNRIRRVDASAQVITAFACTGEVGFSGDGGPATLAKCQYPVASAVDSSGNLCFPDQLNHRVRCVDAATGIITTVAGNGTPGYCGDGGPATDACLNGPHGVGFDSMDNLYIADLYNYRVRRVDGATGVITTVAGVGVFVNFGECIPATEAGIGGPGAVGFDSSDNLFIASFPDPAFQDLVPNHVIRRVDADTGIIATVAGTGTLGFSGDGGPATDAQLAWPYATAVDAAGNLLIADQENDRVRRVEGIAATVDIDGDSVIDYCDNCRAVVNPDQTDTSADDIGNACDADLNNDCSVNFGDLAALKAAFTPRPYNADADFNGDGFVNFGDLAYMKSTFFNGDNPGPGPSGLPNDCDSN